MFVRDKQIILSVPGTGFYTICFGKKYSDYKMKKTPAAFPGVIANTKHPAGLYMPCCHFTDQRSEIIYKECIGEDIGTINNSKQSNYIFNETKLPLKTNRYGLIPELISKLLGISNKLHNNYLIENSNYYLRKGINNSKNKSILL